MKLLKLKTRKQVSEAVYCSMMADRVRFDAWSTIYIEVLKNVSKAVSVGIGSSLGEVLLDQGPENHY